MKTFTFFTLGLAFTIQLAAQTYPNTVPKGDTWYKINNRGRDLVKISASGDYASHNLIAFIVSGSWNTAEYSIISEYNYNHKQIKIAWGYIGDAHERHLVLKSTPTPNAAYANGFTIEGISDPDRDFGLEEVIDLSQITEIEPHNEVYIAEHARKVGIGTSSPSSKLSIRNVGGSSGVKLLDFSEVDDEEFIFKGDFNGTGASGNRLYLGSGLSGWSSSIMSWRGDGNVGIGVSNPSVKLEVDGKIRSEEIKVEVIPGTGPDYVFEPDYNLPTLEETKAYIEQNKHLPEIPSAKEMEANGIDLGEMNMLLLKKIEELTLYLIEQSKQNQAQQAEN